MPVRSSVRPINMSERIRHIWIWTRETGRIIENKYGAGIIFNVCPVFVYLLHLPAAPHGSTRPEPVTGSPTSSEITWPPNLDCTSVDII